jgi:hypothetical protein
MKTVKQFKQSMVGNENCETQFKLSFMRNENYETVETEYGMRQLQNCLNEL